MPGFILARPLHLAVLLCGLLIVAACASTSPQDRRERAVNVCIAKLAASRASDASGVWAAEMARIEDPEKRARAEEYRAAINLACEELLAYYQANPDLLEPEAPELTVVEALDPASP